MKFGVNVMSFSAMPCNFVQPIITMIFEHVRWKKH